MFKHLSIATVLFLFSISAGLYGANSPDKGDQKPSVPRMQYYGRIQLDQDSFDFGYTPQKTRVSHTFWVKNSGNDTLEIVRVRPGCSCTRTRVAKRLVAVGDSSGVEVIFNSGYYRGEVDKKPSITVSDQDSPEHILHYSAYVTYEDDSTANPILDINPAILEIIIGQEKEQYSVMVKNISDQPLKMSLVSTDVRAIDVTIPADEIKPDREAEITIKLVNVDYYKIPGFEKSFTVELSGANHTRYTVPVHYVHETAVKPKGGYPQGWGK